MARTRNKPASTAEMREAYIVNERCPECGGDLDTGWECNTCEFDARPEALEIHERSKADGKEN